MTGAMNKTTSTKSVKILNETGDMLSIPKNGETLSKSTRNAGMTLPISVTMKVGRALCPQNASVRLISYLTSVT